MEQFYICKGNTRVPVYTSPSFLLCQHLTIPWCICQNQDINFGTDAFLLTITIDELQTTLGFQLSFPFRLLFCSRIQFRIPHYTSYHISLISSGFFFLTRSITMPYQNYCYNNHRNNKNSKKRESNVCIS